MNTFLTMTCIFFSLGWAGLVGLVLYAIDGRLLRKITPFITITQSRRIFALFNTYMDFHFSGEKKLFEELPAQYLVMSNHQSLLDIPLFMHFLDGPRLRFVAKEELGNNIPLISLMLRADQHCLIQRSGSPSKAMKTMDIFAERVVRNNWIPVIFPEGTRSLDGNLGTFHAAGFRRLLDKAPMPVVVCAVEGAWRISSLMGMAKYLKGGNYRIKIVKIYPAPTNKAEQVHILEEGKKLIEQQLLEWRGNAI
jgi:1-acyl-sn-glycerol-3-phosphate acyltransferase